MLKFLEGLEKLKKGELRTRKYKDGELVSEIIEQTNWELNEQDLDIIQVQCECGHTFDVPWDVSAFGFLHSMICGYCCKEGKIKVIADPSPNKIKRD